MAAGYCYCLGINSNAFFLNDYKKAFILGLNVPKVTAYRYLEKNHLSGRAQDHFRHHESVSVMQLYAAIRILLINTSSVWDRILLMCRILDILEQCFCDCYSGVTLHPFDGGMEKSVREKMLSVAGYDFGAVISDVGEWKRRE
jgi:hypothetical protein